MAFGNMNKIPTPAKAIAILAAVALVGWGAKSAFLKSGQSGNTEAAGSSPMFGSDAADDGDGSVVSAQVMRADLSQQVSGTGALLSEDPENVIVPAGLEVTEVYVEAGDRIEEGQAIARVSQLSVSEQILAVQESIDSMNDSIKNLSSKDKNYDLKKEVYTAQRDDLVRVRDQMRQLKTDCTLRSDRAGVIETVNLYEETQTGSQPVSAGSEESSSGHTSGEKTDMAYSLNNADLQVTGLVLRSGNRGQMISAAVQETDEDEAQAAAAEGEEPGEDPAQGSGDVSSPDPETASGESGDSGDTGSPESGSGSGSGDSSGIPADGSAQQDSDQTVPDGSHGGRQTDPGSGNNSSGNGGSSPAAPEGYRAITGILKLEVEGPKAGEVPQTELVLSPEEERYTGKIEWIPAAGKFQPKTAYAAVINLKAEEGFFFAVNDGDTKFLDVEVSSTADVEFKYLDLNKDGIVETLRVIAYYPLTGEPVAQDTSDMSGIGDFGGGGGGLGDLGDTEAGDAGSAGKTYSEAEALALTVIPGTNMFIEINVDELDILSLEKGQEAEVRVDAVGEEVFQGTISYIGNKAASGGNGEAAKYKVRVKVERSQKMKAGMNASATITVVNKPDVLVVPVEAIQTEDGKSIVYTALDEQGLPSAPKEVETGLSTSTQVEIVSGLEEGDTVYYFPVTGGLEGMDFGGIDF